MYKIVDDIALARISTNLTELKKLKNGTIKDLKKIDELCKNIEDAIDYCDEYNEGHSDVIIEWLVGIRDDELQDSDMKKEAKGLISAYEKYK